jgi:hypothetical protein
MTRLGIVATATRDVLSPVTFWVAMPTMNGFVWLDAATPAMPGTGTDNWCLRDSISLLFGWSIGSEDWMAFIEGPSPEDCERLIDHLALIRVDPMIPRHFAWLMRNLEHPGVSRYVFRERRTSHAQYEPNLAHYQGLPPQYALYEHETELIGFLVDPTQPAHV